MPIKKRFIECECGEVFTEAKGGLEGNIVFSNWKHEDSRVRGTKTDTGGEIAVVQFIRFAKCAKCDGSLMIEKKVYEVSPAPITGNKDYSQVSVNREFVMGGGTAETPKLK